MGQYSNVYMQDGVPLVPMHEAEDQIEEASQAVELSDRDRLARELFVAEISRTGVGHLDDDKTARDSYDTADAFLAVQREEREREGRRESK